MFNEGSRDYVRVSLDFYCEDFLYVICISTPLHVRLAWYPNLCDKCVTSFAFLKVTD